MTLLRLQLLGGFTIRGIDSKDITPSSRKVCGLLACLALPPGSSWSRDRLAATLWGERGEGQARASLRQALTDLRRSFNPEALLQVDRNSVMLDPAAVTVDAVEFEQAVKASDLKRAATLYRGDLLDDFILNESGFHDWLTVERTRLRDLAVDTFNRLATSQTGNDAIQICQRLLQIESTREETHRLLMNLYAEQNQRALALRQFQICRDILQQELGSRPDRQTEALFQHLQKHSGVPDSAPNANLSVASSPMGRPSIAVLPFINISGDGEQDYFADGIVENIITNLSRFRDLFVIARNSTFAYKGKAIKIQDVSRDLGARYILEGSVQKSNDRIRVTAQLIDGATGGHIWAEHYDRQSEEIFLVQDEVTETIVGTLATAFGGRLRKAWQGRDVGAAGQNFQAFDCFMRAVDIFDSFAKVDVQRARDLFQTAVEIAPNYGKAIAKLALTHIIDAVFGFSNDLPKSWASARRFAVLAIERDDDESWGHWAFGMYHLYQGQHDRAIAELTNALKLNPNDADPMSDYAMILSYAGQADKAIEWAHRAMRLNPHNPNWYLMQLGQIYYDARRYDDAIVVLENLHSLETIWINFYLAASHMALGHASEARRAIELALKFDPQATIKSWITSERTPYKDPKDRERLRGHLHMAGLSEE